MSLIIIINVTYWHFEHFLTFPVERVEQLSVIHKGDIITSNCKLLRELYDE